MTAARDYVTEYEQVDLETVNKNPGLENLKEEAERALDPTEAKSNVSKRSAYVQ